MAVRSRNDRVLEGDVVVVSPHLDDAAFSLGAAIARAARSGATVRVLTVFANDPDSSAPAAWWDRKAGFASEGEAARTRRKEDGEACRVLGATPEWLPFRDASYEPQADDEAIRGAVGQAVQGADLVLLPGFPLRHVDHMRLTRLLLAHPIGAGRMGLFVEQPYAKRDGKRRAWHRPSVPAAVEPFVDAPLRWTSLAAERRDRRAKYRASIAYASQVPLFGRLESRFLGRLLLRRVALYEALRGGEAIAWLD
jgi:LmbE family N-acetylglucosaminyl deacetylase